MLKLNKTNESGRSMVEMLGVLAIIGVLSVMGIAGYTQAMKSHRANEIVNATAICYMLGMAQNAGSGGTAMTYTPKPEGVSSIKFTTQNKIEIDGIADEALCKQIKGKIGDDKVSGDCSSPYKLTVTFGDAGSGINEEDPAKDCITEACCDENGGEWMCANEDTCICNPKGWNGSCFQNNCKLCSPSEGTPKCPEDPGSCVCQPSGYSFGCSGTNCIVCSPSEGNPACPDFYGACVCCVGTATCEEGSGCTCD